MSSDAAANRQSAMRGLLLDSTAATLSASFRAAGIETLLLKGPSVARWLYAEPQARRYVDVDLLVRPTDFAAAESLLAAQGYRHALDNASPSELWEAHEWRSPSGADVDLHRSFHWIAAAEGDVWRELSAGSETMVIAGEPVQTPGEPARCVLLALHAAHHGRAVAQPLQDLGLACRLVDRSVWGAATAIARRLGVVDAFATGLRLVDAGAAIADDLGLPTRASAELLIRADSGSRIAWNLERLAGTRGLRARSAFVARKLVPSPAFMRHRYRLPPTSHRRLLAAYLRRPFELLAGLPSSVRTWRRVRRQARD